MVWSRRLFIKAEAPANALTPSIGIEACADLPLTVTSKTHLPRCPILMLRFVASPRTTRSGLTPCVSSIAFLNNKPSETSS